MAQKNENQIINIIKYTPPIFIAVVSIVITLLLYIEKQKNLEDEKNFIKTQYVKNNKLLMETQVEQLSDFITKTQNETENKLKENIKSRVYEAHSIATNIYEENKETKTKEEIKKLIKDALVNIRFNGNRGYFFIYSMDYECILLPVARKLEGQSFYEFKDGKGFYLTRNIIKQVEEEKEGFLSWWFYKPDDMQKQYKKIGFNKYFEPLDWFIGTGEYYVDFDEEVKKEILEYVDKLSSLGDNNYFVIDYNSNILFNKKLNETHQDANKEGFFHDNEKIISDIIAIAKSGEAFISYIPKEIKSTKLGSTKTIYIKGIQNWEWAIGKVFYQSEIDKLFEEKEKELNNKFSDNLIRILLVSVLLTLMLLLFSFYVTFLLQKKFTKYKDEINTYLEEKTTQHHILAQQSKMASMGEMLGNIAHQWRQPLSIITTAASGMKIQKEFNELDDSSFNSSIDSITSSAKYLSKTIDDFRNFFKPDKREIYFKVKDIFDKTFKLTKSQFLNRDIEIVTNIEDFEVYGLENELVQALINILNNSRDALENRKNERYIFIDAYKKDNIGFIKIKDNAGGINEELINKICEPYFTTKEEKQGTGIGLYMTEEIIKKHMKADLQISNKEFKYDNQSYRGIEFIIEIKLTSN